MSWLYENWYVNTLELYLFCYVAGSELNRVRESKAAWLPIGFTVTIDDFVNSLFMLYGE